MVIGFVDEIPLATKLAQLVGGGWWGAASCASPPGFAHRTGEADVISWYGMAWSMVRVIILDKVGVEEPVCPNFLSKLSISGHAIFGHNDDTTNPLSNSREQMDFIET